ncbi:unnamed protein product [Ectocarpus fasciculatus]
MAAMAAIAVPRHVFLVREESAWTEPSTAVMDPSPRRKRILARSFAAPVPCSASTQHRWKRLRPAAQTSGGPARSASTTLKTR